MLDSIKKMQLLKKRWIFPLTGLLLGLSGCGDDNGSNGGPVARAQIVASGAFQDSLTFSLTYQTLADSARQVPGPLAFKTSVRISGSQKPPDSLTLSIYLLDNQKTLSKQAFLVKRLTLQNTPPKAAAAILRTPDGRLFETQTTRKGQGTVILKQVKSNRLKGELKAVKLSNGSEQVFLSGPFEAVKP